MRDFVIYTDSACDIAPETLKEWGVLHSSLTLRFTDSEEEYLNDDVDAYDFYKKMREGGVAKTAAVNTETFKERFLEILNEGKDILYLGFSSGLSTTFNSARVAAMDLKDEGVEGNVVVIDTLAASAGFGLLVYFAKEMKKDGKSLDEIAEAIKATVPGLCHWFTVDDLVYLKRGGRISSTAAFVGNLLGIKPVLHVDDEGHLINVSKVRGRRGALSALADKYGELAVDKENGVVFISQADCLEDAKVLEAMLSERYGAKVALITDVGPVIGAHSGPGTMALFFVGKNR